MRHIDRPTNEGNEPDRVIGTIRKNAREDITVSLRTYKGTRFVDVRVMAQRFNGEPMPTAKGVTMKADALPDMISLLQQAYSIAVEAGWCNGDDQ